MVRWGFSERFRHYPLYTFLNPFNAVGLGPLLKGKACS